ncbi:hypothetical protein BJ965_000087 [Streptomyces luteogriseus]|uniref:Uncharacterized protein n=1 Tax=Streptomyces luteogriseus TaxID=68233 RepID=A0A7W7DI85_9ACTN|nr:hypothetical protein [Streptomyces luteogriseus]
MPWRRCPGRRSRRVGDPGDTGCIAAYLDRFLTARGISLLRPSYRNRDIPQPAEALLKTVRQLIESVNDTLKSNSTSSSTVDAPSRASVSGGPSGSWQ